MGPVLSKPSQKRWISGSNKLFSLDWCHLCLFLRTVGSSFRWINGSVQVHGKVVCAVLDIPRVCNFAYATWGKQLREVKTFRNQTSRAFICIVLYNIIQDSVIVSAKHYLECSQPESQKWTIQVQHHYFRFYIFILPMVSGIAVSIDTFFLSICATF